MLRPDLVKRPFICLVCPLLPEYSESMTSVATAARRLSPVAFLVLPPQMRIQDLSDSEDEQVAFPLFPPKDTVEESQTNDPSDRRYTPSDILCVTNYLSSKGFPSFAVGTTALRHYGARIIASFVPIAVPQSQHEDATNSLKEHNELSYLGIKSSWVPSGPSLQYPEFKQNGTILRVLLVPDCAWGLRCDPANLCTDGTSGIPYPTVAHFAQSFLRTKHINGLELLVDGQDSSLEWGYENLDFGKHSWKKAVWERSVREKEKRIPRELPVSLYATRFKRRTPTLD